MLWFINQHCGFVQVPHPGYTYNNGIISEFGFPWRSWKSDKETLIKYLNRYQSHALINYKIAIKQIPHNLDSKKIKIHNYHEINTIIFYIEDINDRIYVENRQKIIIDPQKIEKICFDHEYLSNIFLKNQISFTCIDIAKILKCDEDEYKKLLDFIKEPPLENWKTHICEYKKQINIHI